LAGCGRFRSAIQPADIPDFVADSSPRRVWSQYQRFA